MHPPRDPEDRPTLVESLIITRERVLEVLDNSLLKTLTWIMSDKQNYE